MEINNRKGRVHRRNKQVARKWKEQLMLSTTFRSWRRRHTCYDSLRYYNGIRCLSCKTSLLAGRWRLYSIVYLKRKVFEQRKKVEERKKTNLSPSFPKTHPSPTHLLSTYPSSPLYLSRARGGPKYNSSVHCILRASEIIFSCLEEGILLSYMRRCA